MQTQNQNSKATILQRCRQKLNKGGTGERQKEPGSWRHCRAATLTPDCSSPWPGPWVVTAYSAMMREEWSVSSVQSRPTLCDSMDCSTLGLPVHHHLQEFTQTHVHRVSDAIQPSHLCRPLLLPPSIFPSFRVFTKESVLCIRWPKYWGFNFSISSFNEFSGLISFRIDWLDLLAVQGTLKSLLQHHSSKASFLQHSAFLIVQLSHPYTTTGKTIPLTRRTFVGKAMSLFFNMLSRLFITFLPRSKRLLIAWLQSPSTVILELK